MTITIHGISSIASSVAFGPARPFAAVQIGNDDSATETITITQASVIHTDPNAADDMLVAAPPGTLGIVQYYRDGSQYPTGMFDAATGTYVLTGLIDGTPTPAVGPVTVYPLGLRPLTEGISALIFTPPAVTLASHQTLESSSRSA